MITPQPTEQAEFDPLVSLARSTYLTRKMRGELFDADLFGEPAWDLLLVLFVNDRDRAPCAIDGLATELELSVPALRRWLDIVAARGLVHVDGECVELSAKGAQTLRQYLKRQVAALMEMMAAFRAR